MSLINMLNWWQWGLLAAIPPAIVLLYFLKLKRQPLEVPSTYLWHKSIEDLHVNSIWQRLRTSILLLLQLLLVLIALLALARPGWSGAKLEGHRFLFLIDTSASMSATDVKPTRLAEAKRRAGEAIAQMSAGDVAAIISFSDTARVEQLFTDNRRDLERQLDAIRPTNRATQLGEALGVAAGLAKTDQQAGQGAAPSATMYLFSDGKFPDVAGFSLGNIKPVFFPIGVPGCSNVAITAFSTRRREDKKDQLQAFARLENFSTREVTAQVELFRDEQLLDASKVRLDANGSGGVVFELGDLHSGVLRLALGETDELELDNQAWAAIDPRARSRVLLVTAGDDALELALGTESARELAEVEIARPEVLETTEYQQKAASGAYSLVIYDQCQPRQMPQANTLFIGRLPPGAAWSGGAKAPAPQIIDIDAAHPLMHLIDLGNVRFVEGQSLKPPAGSTVLISTDAGPLLAIAPREGFEDAVLGAEIVGRDEQGESYANTDWPLRLSFPVFILNALSYFGGTAGAAINGSVQPGQGVLLRSGGSTETLEVRAPDGERYPLKRQQAESFSFGVTDELGVYDVEEPGQPPRHFAVNLFNAAESAIEPRLALQIGYDEVRGNAGWEGARRELWKPLLLGALGVLCLEWYIYNRRVYL